MSNNLKGRAFVALTAFILASVLTARLSLGSGFSGGGGGVTSAALDSAFGSTRGAILERAASGWTTLAPGTSGTVLTSNGAGADPAYAAGSTYPVAPTTGTATAGGASSVAVGPSSSAGQQLSVAVGNGATANTGGGGSIAIGYNSSAPGTTCTAVGYNSVAGTAALSVATAFGASASAAQNNGVAIGANSLSAGSNACAVGKSANAAGSQDTAIGNSASTGNGSPGSANVAVGYSIACPAGNPANDVLVGAAITESSGGTTRNTAIGSHIALQNTTNNSVAIGYGAIVNGNNSIAIGSGTSLASLGDNVCVIGFAGNAGVIMPDTDNLTNLGQGGNTFHRLALGDYINKYKNIFTAGYGVPAIFGTGRVTAQSAANASIATYTVGAADGSFEVSANMNVTAATAISTALQCVYTDESNTSNTMTFPTTGTSGGFLSGGLVTGTGAFETPVMHIRCKAATTITIKTAAGTFTGVTYTAEGVIKQTQ